MKASWKGWQAWSRFWINWTSAKIITFRAKSLKICKGGTNLPSDLTFPSSNRNFPNNKWDLSPPNSSKRFRKNASSYWRAHLRSSCWNLLLQSASSCWIRMKTKPERSECVICKEQRKNQKKPSKPKHQKFYKDNCCLQKSMRFQNLPIRKLKIRQWMPTL